MQEHDAQTKYDSVRMNKRNALNTGANPCGFAEVIQEEELQVWTAEWKMLLALAKGAHGNRKHLHFLKGLSMTMLLLMKDDLN